MDRGDAGSRAGPRRSAAESARAARRGRGSAGGRGRGDTPPPCATGRRVWTDGGRTCFGPVSRASHGPGGAVAGASPRRHGGGGRRGAAGRFRPPPDPPHVPTTARPGLRDNERSLARRCPCTVHAPPCPHPLQEAALHVRVFPPRPGRRHARRSAAPRRLPGLPGRAPGRGVGAASVRANCAGVGPGRIACHLSLPGSAHAAPAKNTAPEARRVRRIVGEVSASGAPHGAGRKGAGACP